MRIYDVTRPISPGMEVYPGDAPTQVAHTSHLERGDPCTLSHLCLSAHAGTHVDAPCHFIPGAATVDQAPLDVLIGPCQVRQVFTPRVDAPTLAALALPPGTRRLLLKSTTAPPHVRLTADAAHWLLRWGLRLVGLDRLSVDGVGATRFPVHHALLGAGVVIVEALDLAAVPPGAYHLVCLPLRLAGGDGAPARAVLLSPEDAQARGMGA